MKFAITLEQIKLAWRTIYEEAFPSDIVGLVDMASYKLPPAPHELAAAANAAHVEVSTGTTYNPITHNVYKKIIIELFPMYNIIN